MIKIIIFFLLLIFSSQSNSSETDKQNFVGCDNSITEHFLKNYQNYKIEKIEVDILNYRNWTMNNIKIITSGTRFINDEFKRKFKANIIVSYKNGIKCNLKARVRHSGDAKDHIALNGNSIIQSLDISLEKGNIKGITKFKLFKPDVRGNLSDVVIQNKILRNFGYLAPRSFKVKARVNQSESVMLFQEKAAKELLEFNNRREGPILEGDQKFFFKLVKDIPDNNLSNWDVGTPVLRNKSIKVMLSKLTNANLINRGDIHKEISYAAVNKLNLIYLYYANRFQDEKNDFYFFDYDFDNELLGLFDKEKILKLNIYNLFMQSTNSHHALSVSNRKFYWNPIERFYEPITYDANPQIDLNSPTTGTKILRQPLPLNFNEVILNLENKLDNIDTNKFYDEITLLGIDLTKDQVEKKISKIKINLNNIKENYVSSTDENVIKHNKFKKIDNILNKFNENMREIDPNAYIVKYNSKNKNLERCKIYLVDCQIFKPTRDQLSNLLEGELRINNTNYQYIGSDINLDNLNKKDEPFTIIDLKTSLLFLEKGIQFEKNEDENIFKLSQNIPGAKAYFIGGNLENYQIIFEGKNIVEDNKKFDLTYFPKNFPINNRGLTGCLSFINMNVKNLNIKSNISNCEDSINFINVSGKINNLTVINSFSDGLDVDFSNLEFEDINIKSARNDCADFSSGDYKLGFLKLEFCGDKGLSVGEKSLINLDQIYVDRANMGLAVKDSSIVKLNLANLKNIKVCVAAYKKKQEYEGGFIKMKNMECSKFYKQAEIDNFSKIISAKSDLKNDVFGETYNPSNFKLSLIEDKKDLEKLLKDYQKFNKNKTFDALIEVSAGMSEKWELSESSGTLDREFYMGLPKKINHSPYPVNYGMIPGTVFPISRGGDGDPLDIIILGEPLMQGQLVKVKAIGVLKMNDNGDQDNKIIAVKEDSNFFKFNNLDHLRSENPDLLKEIKLWFERYKGKNVVKFKNYGSSREANELINTTSRFYKRFRLRGRS